MLSFGRFKLLGGTFRPISPGVPGVHEPSSPLPLSLLLPPPSSPPPPPLSPGVPLSLSLLPSSDPPPSLPPLLVQVAPSSVTTTLQPPSAEADFTFSLRPSRATIVSASRASTE